MKAIKTTLFSTLAMLANMATSLAQDFGVVSMTPAPSSSYLDWEEQIPEVFGMMTDKKIVRQIEDSQYFVIDYNLMEQYWENNVSFPVVLEDGSIIRDGSTISTFEKLRFFAGEGTKVEMVNIMDITAATQDGHRGRDK